MDRNVSGLCANQYLQCGMVRNCRAQNKQRFAGSMRSHAKRDNEVVQATETMVNRRLCGQRILRPDVIRFTECSDRGGAVGRQDHRLLYAKDRRWSGPVTKLFESGTDKGTLFSSSGSHSAAPS